MKKIPLIPIILLFLLTQVSVYAQSSDSTSILDETVLSPSEQENYQTETRLLVEDLGKYISIIGDKSVENWKSMRAIDLAVNLFVTDTQKVEVSSKGKGVVRRSKIRMYLDELRLLQYNQVSIEWAEIGRISDFRESSDGTYRAIVTILQRFKGYRDGKMIYEDTTRKNIEIVLKQQVIEGIGTEKKWVIKLGDINVVETY